MVDSMSELMPVPRVRKSESISSKKTMTGTPSSAFSRARWKTSADLALGLADVLVEQLGPLDVEEVERTLRLPVSSATFWDERVRHGLGDQGLAAPRRTVEQDALGRGQLVVLEQRAVQVGQLDRVGDGLDLLVESADVGVADVGDLFEDQLLGLLATQLLGEQVRAQVEQQRVAAAQLDVAQRSRRARRRAPRRRARRRARGARRGPL